MKYPLAKLFGVASLAIFVTSCGGGTDGTGALPPPPPPSNTVTSSGAMTKGSVILNGIHFDSGSTSVIDDRGRAAAQLDNGMVIRLRGRSDDNVTGIADLIDVENEARGPVQSIDKAANPRRFTVAGLVVLVDDQTVYANLTNFDALAVGARVEVHGLRDSGGALHGTRVEAVGAQQGADEIRGAIGNVQKAQDRFKLNGTITVDYGGATFAPAGASEASLTDGALVEVQGTLTGSVFTASRVEVEALEDVDLRGKPNEKQEVEGFISGFTAHPGVFQVDGRTVQTTDATIFQGGTAEDLANDVRLEIDGVLDAQSVLVATKVKFSRVRVIVQGLATAVDVVGRSLVVLTQIVHVDDLTRIDARPSSGNGRSDLLSDIVPNIDCVEVRGHMESGALVAERIRELNNCGADVIQANVTGKEATLATLNFFGGLVAMLPPGAEYHDLNGAAITRTAFLALINPAGPNNLGTLAKLRGTSVAATFVTQTAEVKN